MRRVFTDEMIGLTTTDGSPDMPKPPPAKSSGAYGRSLRAGERLAVSCLCERRFVRVRTNEILAGRTGLCRHDDCAYLARRYPELVTQDYELCRPGRSAIK